MKSCAIPPASTPRLSSLLRLQQLPLQVSLLRHVPEDDDVAFLHRIPVLDGGPDLFDGSLLAVPGEQRARGEDFAFCPFAFPPGNVAILEIATQGLVGSPSGARLCHRVHVYDPAFPVDRHDTVSDGRKGHFGFFLFRRKTGQGFIQQAQRVGPEQEVKAESECGSEDAGEDRPPQDILDGPFRPYGPHVIPRGEEGGGAGNGWSRSLILRFNDCLSRFVVNYPFVFMVVGRSLRNDLQKPYVLELPHFRPCEYDRLNRLGRIVRFDFQGQPLRPDGKGIIKCGNCHGDQDGQDPPDDPDHPDDGNIVPPHFDERVACFGHQGVALGFPDRNVAVHPENFFAFLRLDVIDEVPDRSGGPVFHIHQVEGHEIGILFVCAVLADGEYSIHRERLDVAFFGGHKRVTCHAEGTRSSFDLIGGVLIGDPDEHATPFFRGLHGFLHPRGNLLQKTREDVGGRSEHEKDLLAVGPRRFPSGVDILYL